MSRGAKLSWYNAVQFFCIPFAIGAAFHWFGAWVGIPLTLVGGMQWIGICVMMVEEK